ncbi:MAG: SDR family oxidoreductase [bacterium]|nr:SDR family oxidoreductase [bacterium]
MRGKVALVTGAASGIGAAVATLLSEAGARVVLADIDSDAGQVLADRLGERFVQCDVASPESWGNLIDRCLAEAGVPDFAHLNAGIMAVEPEADFLQIEDLPLENYRRIMGVNLDGVFLGLQGLIPHMRGPGGAITVTASVAGLVGIAMDPVYAATKHALVGLVRSLAECLVDTRLRVNVICPGGVETAITPAALRESEMSTMPAQVMAQEVLDLLAKGLNGEIRVKLTKDEPAFTMPAPLLE